MDSPDLDLSTEGGNEGNDKAVLSVVVAIFVALTLVTIVIVII